jgi:hypothetical protein
MEAESIYPQRMGGKKNQPEIFIPVAGVNMTLFCSDIKTV